MMESGMVEHKICQEQITHKTDSWWFHKKVLLRKYLVLKNDSWLASRHPLYGVNNTMNPLVSTHHYIQPKGVFLLKYYGMSRGMSFR